MCSIHITMKVITKEQKTARLFEGHKRKVFSLGLHNRAHGKSLRDLIKTETQEFNFEI